MNLKSLENRLEKLEAVAGTGVLTFPGCLSIWPDDLLEQRIQELAALADIEFKGNRPDQVQDALAEVREHLGLAQGEGLDSRDRPCPPDCPRPCGRSA